MPILKLAPKEVTEALKHHDDEDWLNQHPPGAPFVPPPPPVPDAEPFNWWIVGGVGIVAFFVLIVVLMY
jgi:hypothetical protein